MKKEYLGDTVYAEVNKFGALVLTTSGGMRDTNTIILETPVIMALEDYLKRAREVALGTRLER